jgi:hypothetical protein
MKNDARPPDAIPAEPRLMPVTIVDGRALGATGYKEQPTGMEGRVITIVAREGKALFLLFDRSVIRACLDMVMPDGTVRFSVSMGTWTGGEAPDVAAPADLKPIIGQALRAIRFYSNRMQIEFDRHRVILSHTGTTYCFPHLFSQETVH